MEFYESKMNSSDDILFLFLLIFYMQWHDLGENFLLLNIWEITVKTFYAWKKV